MRKWLKKFDAAMVAAAFAEAGEFETAKETLKEKRKILLALTGEASDRNAFKYALNTSRRIGADLDILYVANIAKDTLKQYRSALDKEGIDYSIIQKKGSLEKEIRNHTGMKRDILFVVVEISEDMNINTKKSEKIIKDAWKNLQCPLVVVSQNTDAFAT